MNAGLEAPAVGEIQVLRDESTAFDSSLGPELGIVAAREIFLLGGMNIVSEAPQKSGDLQREILVELGFHWTLGTAGMGRSSSAEAAANAIAAQTSSALRVGKSARMSSAPSPAARLANTVLSNTRVPLKIGSPPQIWRSRTIRSLDGGVTVSLIGDAYAYFITRRCAALTDLFTASARLSIII